LHSRCEKGRKKEKEEEEGVVFPSAGGQGERRGEKRKDKKRRGEGV